MTTIIETLEQPGPPETGDSIAVAQSRLVRAGAQFVEEALRDNPDGPVQMITTISRTDNCFDVVIGDAEWGDRGRARTIWRRIVVFGHTDRTVAGGADHVAAARMQEEVARSALTLLEARR